MFTTFTLNVLAFNPRTSAPDVKEYNKSNPYTTGQCTWYAWGRAREILGKTPHTWQGNAGAWYKYNENKKWYSWGKEPRVGAIMVTHKKGYSSDVGHVAIVEKISGSKMTISEYNWTKTNGFDTAELNTNVKTRGKHELVGYIYLTDDKPYQPTITKCEAKSETSIEIKWNKVSNAEKYKVVRHETDGANSKTLTSNCTGTSFTDKGLKSGHTYYYVVYAGKGKKWSDASKEYKTYTKPSIPEVSVRRDSASSLTLSWNKVSGAHKYIIRYRKCKPGTSKPDYETLKTVEGTSFTHTKLSKGTQYCYRVIAVREGSIGEAGNHSQQQVKSDYKTKSGFTLFDRPKTTLKDNKYAVLSWSKASGDNTYAYRIERTSPSGQYTDLGRTTALTYTDTSAPSGEICRYKITALKADDGYKTATTIGEIYAGSKINKAVTLTPLNGSTMRVSWDKAKSATGVKYIVRKYVNNNYVDIATTTNTYYDDTNLKAGNTYAYYVQVRDNDNNYLTSTFDASAVLEILPNKISLNRTEMPMSIGDTVQLTGTVSPDNATNKNIVWESSNSNIATVSNGKVTAVAEGTANITAITSNGIKTSCSITVKPAVCTHAYGEWIEEIAPTCENDGIRHRICSKCGEKESESIPATGHSYSDEWTIITAATCTEPGEKAHTCTKCSAKADVTPIPATDHNFSGEWQTEKAATCLEEGIEYRKCANCDTKETRSTEKTAHNYILTNEVDMTLDAPGYKTYTCSICNDSYTEEYVPEINAGIIEIGSGAPKAGGLVTLPVTISQNPGIAGFLFKVNYDKSALIPKEITRGALTADGTFTSNLEQGLPVESLNSVTAYWSDSNSVTEDGELFNITFEVKSGAAEGEYPVSLSYEKGDITDEMMDDVMPDTLGGMVTIADILRGDVNLDRRVDMLDSILLSRYLAKWNITFNESQEKAANVFADSRINAKDGVRLSQILSGYEIVQNISLLSASEVNLEVGKVDALAGDYISVPITISENEGIAGFNFKLEYDKNKLTPVAVTKGDILNDGSFTTNLIDETTGEDLDYITAYWNSTYNMTNNGELFRVEFLVNESAEIGQAIPVKLSYDENDLCDSYLNNVGANITDGNITVTGIEQDIEADADLDIGYHIGEITMKSADGSTYSKIPQNGNFELLAEVAGICSDVSDILPAKFIVAAYGFDNRLISIKTKEISEQMIQNGEIGITVDSSEKAISELKIFVWDSINNMKPLADKVIISNK